MLKYISIRKFEPNAPCGSRAMSIFTKRARLAKMMLDDASSPFLIPLAGQYCYVCLFSLRLCVPVNNFSVMSGRMDNTEMDKYTKFEPNIPCGSRVMNIFTKRARPAKMTLGEASLPFCIPVTAQC